MLNICILSIIMIFFAIGVYFTVKEIVSILIRSHIPVRVAVEVGDNANQAETTVRAVMAANPEGEIVVVSRGEDEETERILKKLSEDNSRIHIISCKESIDN